MTAITACMGGWCAKRDHCANFHAASPQQMPAERLCPPGRDGAEMVRHHEPAATFHGFDFTLPTHAPRRASEASA